MPKENLTFTNLCWTFDMALEGRATVFTGIEFGVVIVMVKGHDNYG
jgi:hypothetical protein